MFSRTARASAQLACRWMSTERALLRQPDPVVPKSLTGQYIALGATVAAAVFVVGFYGWSIYIIVHVIVKC